MSSKKNNSQSIKIVIVAVSIVLILFSITLIIKITNNIPDNPPTLTGNTGGNLNNGGFFCESDGKVYFANAYSDGSLYSMNPDQTDIKMLTKGNCGNINVGGDFLYFTMSTPDSGSGLGFLIKTSGIYRTNKKGDKIKCLTEEESLTSTLVGNNIYYQGATGSGVGLKKVSIRGGNGEVVEDLFVINPACAVDGSIYFGGTQSNHYLYSLNTASDSVNALWDGDVWNPVYDGGYFYYMDISDKYSICRYSPSAASVDILTHDRADNFNVGYGYVYYVVSVGDEPGLYRMRTDGSEKEKIMSGYICDVNMTSTYTYFREFGTTTPVYCVPTTGANYPTEFTAAIDKNY